MLPRASTEFYAFQQRVNATAANEVRRQWGRMGDDFDASWRRIGPTVLATLVAAQQQVAVEALRYVPRVLAETDLPDQPEGAFRPQSLVGIASDGRPLESLAHGAVIQAKVTAGGGAGAESALAAGGDWLDLMAKLQIADAARQAVGVMTAARKNIAGTVRVLNPPSCQRCAILAGRFYRWSKGFDRHPRCDCVNLPSKSEGWAKAEGFLADPMNAYRRGEIRDLTEAQRFAIDNGADIIDVVNATRGMSTAATRRIRKTSATGGAAPKPGQPNLLALLEGLPRAEALGRMTPEGIYQIATDRDDAIRLLREWGYIA